MGEAIDDVCAALAADGANPVERLVACDLLGWGLQGNPADRPPSCKKMLEHAFFDIDIDAAAEEQEGKEKQQEEGTAAQEEKGIEETKNGAAAEEQGEDEAAVPAEEEEIELAKDSGAVLPTTQFRVADVPTGLHTPTFHVAAALGDLAAIKSALADAAETAAAEVLNEREPLLNRHALHLAAAYGHPDVVQYLIDQPTVDAGAHDAAGRSPLDHAQAMLERLKGNVEQEKRLNAVVANLSEADLLKQIERQTTEGVTVEEGQRVRDWFQSQIGGNVVSEGCVCVKAQ